MLMVYLPLVIARWIHFVCVFVLFGFLLLLALRGTGEIIRWPWRIAANASRDNHYSAHRCSGCSDFRRRLARVYLDQYREGLW